MFKESQFPRLLLGPKLLEIGVVLLEQFGRVQAIGTFLVTGVAVLALLDLLPLLWDIKHKATEISLQCDRVAEMEHAADDAYEEYIGYIFSEEENLREMTKYKNLAELFEKATDSEKHVADCVRLMVLKFLHE